MGREHYIFFYKGSLSIDSYSNPVLFYFLYAIQSAGLLISIDTVEHMEPFGHDLNFLRPSDRQTWYESKEYSRVLKTESWWPSRLLMRIGRRQGEEVKGPFPIDCSGDNEGPTMGK